MMVTTSYNYIRALPLLTATALIMYGSLQCLHRKQSETDINEIPFAPPFGINATLLISDIKKCIDIPDTINHLENMVFDVIDISTMIRKHEMNKAKSTQSKIKPLLIIIDPVLFFDVKLVDISKQKASNKSSLSEIICGFNENALKFSLRSDKSGKHYIYAYRQDLIVFISWLHRLDLNQKIDIEIIAYSNQLNMNQLLYHVNLIQIYYNSVTLSNYNSDQWFKFIAAITSYPYHKSYKEIDALFPFRDYQFVFIVDDDPKNWNVDHSISNNVISLNAPRFTMGSFNQKMGLIQEKGDTFLLSLKEFIKNIVINKQYRSIIKESMENQQIPFWNKLSDDGKIKKLTLGNDHHWH